MTDLRKIKQQLEYQQEIEGYILQHFDEAIANEEIEVFYQPIVRTISGNVCSVEALSRWFDGVYGQLSPALFIPVLEDNNLITKLDLFVLRRACRDLNDILAAGKTVVPISINLSRFDFVECDIFREVENIVLQNNIPRDLINIEITESTIVENPMLMRREIDRFRTGGYQVWMDDFGSGHSSLNVLRQFDFDVIKLDKDFMNDFDNKAKKIIESIITMAKQIGIQTLIEGVETIEQYEYLHRIGCEKIQGFYFNRPLSLPDFRAWIKDYHRHLEERKWRPYYNAMGSCNFLTDRSFALVEYDSKNFRFLYINEKYRLVWKQIGVENMANVYENMNASNSPLAHQLRDFERSLTPGGREETVFYTVRGHYVRLRMRCLARVEEKSVLEVGISKMDADKENEKRERLDNIFRAVYSAYDSFYLIDWASETYETIVSSGYVPTSGIENLYRTNKLEIERSANMLIHPEDVQEYLQFMNKDDLLVRLQNSPRGYLTQFFRTKNENGAYVWKTHTVMYLPDVHRLIYVTRRVDLSQPGLLQKVQPLSESNNTVGKYAHRYERLHRMLMDSQIINLFWKDKNRRFVGANHKFMRTYGFKDSSAFVGKTDEEMGWHLDDGPFRDDEIAVIDRGEIIANHVGSCIIRGVAHNIIANKEPIYENGEIVGLVGFFIKVDELLESFGDTGKVNIIDPLTGAFSVQGLISMLAEYAEGWTRRKEDFAVLKISIAEYQRAIQYYGDEIAKQILREVTQKMIGVIGNRGVCARVVANDFVILTKFTDRNSVMNMAGEIREKLLAIRKLSGYDATINPLLEVRFADESNNYQDILNYALEGATAKIAEQKVITRYFEQQNDLIMEGLPIGICKLNIEKKPNIFFANKGFTDICGYKLEELKSESGSNCYELFYEDGDRLIFEEAVESLRSGEREAEITYRMRHKEGKVVWVSEKITAYRNLEGGQEALSVFMDITERIAEQEKLRDTLEIDPMTGLLNSTAYEKRVSDYLKLHQEENMVIAMIDVDNFKDINDRFGHAIGDRAIKAMAEHLQTYPYGYEHLVSRVGGDEFSFVVTGMKNWAEFEKRKQIFIDACQVTINTDDANESRHTLIGSVGFAYYGRDGYEYQELLKRADEEMYAMKRAHNAGR